MEMVDSPWFLWNLRDPQNSQDMSQAPRLENQVQIPLSGTSPFLIPDPYVPAPSPSSPPYPLSRASQGVASTQPGGAPSLI